jgi:uncharacterized NAD-dependent epimerase/dehydratase family protein
LFTQNSPSESSSVPGLGTEQLRLHGCDTTASQTQFHPSGSLRSRLTNPAARFAGVSLNTSSVDAAAATRAVAEVSGRTGLPCCDPIRHGVAPLVDRILEAA